MESGNGYDVDVIVVYDSTNTPYYLTENTRGVLPNNIYTRIQDSNTPRDKSADLHIVEKLWKKRFGIDVSALERFKILLNDTDKWNCDWGNKKYAYHSDFPEFQLIQADNLEQGWWPAATFYIHPKMHMAPLFLKYHDTIIYETELWCFDNFRKYLPKAENYCVDRNLTFYYSYYLLDSIEGKLLTIFTKGSNNISSREPNYHQLLIFENEDEKNEFDSYLCEHFSDYTDDFIANKYQYQIKEDTDANLGGLQYSAFQVAKAALLYEDWLKIK